MHTRCLSLRTATPIFKRTCRYRESWSRCCCSVKKNCIQFWEQICCQRRQFELKDAVESFTDFCYQHIFIELQTVLERPVEQFDLCIPTHTRTHVHSFAVKQHSWMLKVRACACATEHCCCTANLKLLARLFISNQVLDVESRYSAKTRMSFTTCVDHPTVTLLLTEKESWWYL